MIYILISIFLWSSLGIVIKLSQMPVHVLIFFSCIISSLLIGISIVTSTVLRQQLPDAKMTLSLLALAIISLVNTFSFFFAYKNTTVANAVLTHYTAPVFVALLAPIFLKERLTIKVLLSVAIASAGLWIMLSVSPIKFFNLLFSRDINTLGIFSGLFSGFAYAVLIIVIRVISQKVNPIIMTLYQNAIIAAILLPFIQIPADFRSAIWAFAFMGVIHSTLAPILYFKGMKVVTANKSAILGYLEPVCAILLSTIFLGEAVSYKTVLGGSMIIISGYITIRS